MDMEPDKPLPKVFWVVLAVVVAIAAVAFVYVKILGRPFFWPTEEEKVLTEEEKLMKEQAGKLDELRARTNPAPVTQEMTEDQNSQLDAFRAQAGSKSLTQQEIDKQLEELNKLRY